MLVINALIKKTSGTEKEAERAVNKLVGVGMPVIQAVVDSIRAGSPGDTWKLCTVLRQIRAPEIVPVLIELMGDENPNLAISAFTALGYFNDIVAIEALQTYLVNSVNPPTQRSLAAEALGTLRYPDSVNTLNDVVNEIIINPDVSPVLNEVDLDKELYIDEDLIMVLIASIIALSKLGQHDLISTVISLTRYSGVDPYSEDQVIRAMAVEALQYTIGPGIFSAEQKALRDEYYEVRSQAIDVAFYLGTKEAISELIKCREDDDPYLSDNIYIRISELTGVPLKELREEKNLLSWWETSQASYKSGICYRFGQPIDLGRVILLLKEPHMREQAIKELQIVTGENFGFNPYIRVEKQNNLLSIAQHWWNENSKLYKKGGLYKYGYQQDLYKILTSIK